MKNINKLTKLFSLILFFGYLNVQASCNEELSEEQIETYSITLANDVNFKRSVAHSYITMMTDNVEIKKSEIDEIAKNIEKVKEDNAWFEALEKDDQKAVIEASAKKVLKKGVDFGCLKKCTEVYGTCVGALGWRATAFVACLVVGIAGILGVVAISEGGAAIAGVSAITTLSGGCATAVGLSIEDKSDKCATTYSLCSGACID